MFECRSTGSLLTRISRGTSLSAYVGFTAGTGALTNRHLIDSLEVTELLRGVAHKGSEAG